MDKKTLQGLHQTAEEFGDIARKVNRSSRKRKDFSKKAIANIKKSMAIGNRLTGEIVKNADVNIKMRDHDSMVLNSCLIIKSNIVHQRNIVGKLKKMKEIDRSIVDLLEKNTAEMLGYVNEALSLLRKIVQKDNIIILIDNRILIRKKFQHNSLKGLLSLAEKSLMDAEEAIKGSSSNLERGMDMVKGLKTTGKIVDEKNENELKVLLDKASQGWRIAEDVFQKSLTQFEFAEKVKDFTQQLYRDSNTIKNLVIRKHEIFKQNLDFITGLTVIISIQFEKYLEVERFIDSIYPYPENKIPLKVRNFLYDLVSYVKIACEDISTLTTVNFDMTESIRTNSKLENSTVELTNEELKYYNNVKQQVKEMTEITRYPVKGSKQNIKYGKELEQMMKEIISSLNK